MKSNSLQASAIPSSTAKLWGGATLVILTVADSVTFERCNTFLTETQQNFENVRLGSEADVKLSEQKVG